MLPDDSAARKRIPLASGVLFYFDSALVQVAYCGPLLCANHADAIVRHLLLSGKGNNSAMLCKHSLALLQKEIKGTCEEPGSGLGALFDIYSDAFEAIAGVSYIGSKKHNPGGELFHARGISMDNADCILRHRAERGQKDSSGARHSAYLAWRCHALYQLELEEQGAPLARNARVCKTLT